MIFGGLATSNSVPFCLHYIQAFRLCQDEKWGCVSHSWSSPSGTTPQSANADSSPFRGAKGVAGYNIRYKKPMPPLKGRGGPRSGGEVRPRRQRLPIPQPTLTHSKTPRDESLGALHFTGNLPESDSGKITQAMVKLSFLAVKCREPLSAIVSFRILFCAKVASV